ncbi:MAG: hypothetical protein WAN68_17005, partial [Pseudolabrys sp.]
PKSSKSLISFKNFTLFNLVESPLKRSDANLFFIERYRAKEAVLTSPLGCDGVRFHGAGDAGK